MFLCVCVCFLTFKSSYDALDGRYGADRHRVVEAVLNNSLKKQHLKANKVTRKLSHSKMFKHRPLDHILEWFLYHSDLKILPRPPEPSELPENLKIKLKWTQSFWKTFKNWPHPTPPHLGSLVTQHVNLYITNIYTTKTNVLSKNYVFE